MRLFIAVDPPAEVTAGLAAALLPLRAAVPDGRPRLRWSAPELWHVTLTFCGEVDERKLPELSERLGRAAHRHQPFALRVSGAGGFSRPSRAHALWFGLDGDPSALSALAASTSAAARRCGIPVEDRKFRAHLTVARCSPAGDVRPYVEALALHRSQEWTVSELHLVHSHLGPRTTHERIASWSLG